MYQGLVPGSDPRAQSARVAGVFAEAGLTRLVLEQGGVRSELRARETDLPGLIVTLLQSGAEGWSLYSWDGAAVVWGELGTLRWRAADAALAKGLGGPAEGGEPEATTD